MQSIHVTLATDVFSQIFRCPVCLVNQRLCPPMEFRANCVALVRLPRLMGLTAQPAQASLFLGMGCASYVREEKKLRQTGLGAGLVATDCTAMTDSGAKDATLAGARMMMYRRQGAHAARQEHFLPTEFLASFVGSAFRLSSIKQRANVYPTVCCQRTGARARTALMVG